MSFPRFGASVVTVIDPAGLCISKGVLPLILKCRYCCAVSSIVSSIKFFTSVAILKTPCLYLFCLAVSFFHWHFSSPCLTQPNRTPPCTTPPCCTVPYPATVLSSFNPRLARPGQTPPDRTRPRQARPYRTPPSHTRYVLSAIFSSSACRRCSRDSTTFSFAQLIESDSRSDVT